jgi:hypothetical protein
MLGGVREVADLVDSYEDGGVGEREKKAEHGDSGLWRSAVSGG